MSGMGTFIDEQEEALERIRREKAAAGANPQLRQQIIARIRQYIRRCENWEQHIKNLPPNQRQPTDDGDLIWLEVMKEDWQAELRSLGVQLESHAPTMRELMDQIAI